MNLPVLILGYLRFDEIIQTLSGCSKAGISEVYLSIDGAKSSDALEAQRLRVIELQQLAKHLSLNLHIRHRQTNVGVAVGVIEGITWFFENVEFGAILEDDLVFDESFFRFVSDARSQFQNVPEVAIISGNNFSDAGNQDQISACHYPLIWGWATWKDIWVDFLSSLNKSFKPKINYRRSIAVNFFWFTAAIQSRSGLVDSWAMSFVHYFRSSGKIAVLPPQNIVTNKGADNFASHSNYKDEFINFPMNEIRNVVNWELPNRRQLLAQDKRLEKYHFRITARNILSPVKLSFSLLKNHSRVRLDLRLGKSKTDCEILYYEDRK